MQTRFRGADQWLVRYSDLYRMKVCMIVLLFLKEPRPNVDEAYSKFPTKSTLLRV